MHGQQNIKKLLIWCFELVADTARSEQYK
jgi:hypothetical protein